MTNKYVSAAIAGFAFGILIGLTSVIPCMIIVSFALMLAVGVIAVLLAKEEIKTAGDAVLTSGLAGLVSGIIGTVVATAALTAVIALIKFYNGEDYQGHELAGSGIFALLCGPVLIICGVLLAAIGGYLYREFAMKNA